MNSLLLTDGYKVAHHLMYPENTTLVYSNMTARSDKYASSWAKEYIISFGQQAVIKWLKDHFDNNFFKKSKEEVIDTIKEDLSQYLNTNYNVDHFNALHDLGYLPICVKSIPEGTKVPLNIPYLTIYNTLPEFFWLTNYLETIISNMLWQPITVATIMNSFKNIGKRWYDKTDKDNLAVLDYAYHNFAMRGLCGLDATVFSGMAFSMFSIGSDSLPVIQGLKDYYGAETCEVFSVNATEHSVMSAGGFETEIETYKRLLNLFPTGPLSVVSDTWDLWNVVANILPQLKNEILARDGKLVIRPDSSPTTPADIICGTSNKYTNIGFIESELTDSYFRELLLDEVRADTPHGECGVSEHTSYYKINDIYYTATISNIMWDRRDKQFYFIDSYNTENIVYTEDLLTIENKGLIQSLWDTFGGTLNSQGLKVLDQHIGAIYGEAIQQDMLEEIYSRLSSKGFAASNILIGIGSFSQTFISRDTYGNAIKATYIETEEFFRSVKNEDGVPINIESQTKGINIFKDPKTSSSFNKKSAKGLLQVYKESPQTSPGYNLYLKQECTWEEESQGELVEIFRDGKFYNQTTLTEIRDRVKNK